MAKKRENLHMRKQRLVVLTDIHDSWFPWTERDDIQSLARLLLYSDVIDIEGIIACTSCFLKKGARRKDLQIIQNVIDAYEKVYHNLCIHSQGYPDADYLRSCSCCGISVFGKEEGKGFAQDIYRDNEGVRSIISAVDKQDDRPVHIALWGGANTLAQAIWNIETSRSEKELERFLKKMRIHSISDQDYAGSWIRKRYGEFLSYEVTPSPVGSGTYYQATWPGISADSFSHGSEDGIQKGGFSGADSCLVSNEWIRENVQSHGVYGKIYPSSVFIMEGDTPSWLNLIPNGLDAQEHPDSGGWGGRYQWMRPSKEQFHTEEYYKIWTNSSDTVKGIDGKKHTSPQATIWRWREAMQNDFATRMDWTVCEKYEEANHHPVAILNHPNVLKAVSGECLELDASLSNDPDGRKLSYHWFLYPEAGSIEQNVLIQSPDCEKTKVFLPQIRNEAETAHIILEVKNNGEPALTTYQRVRITIRK